MTSHKIGIIALLIIIVITLWALTLHAGMTDADAMNKAKIIWGPLNAAIGRYRKFGDVGWTYQVGCVLPDGSFSVIGSAPVSFDAAFALVDMNINGPHILTAVARDTAGNQTTSAPVTVYACNKTPPQVAAGGD